ncbi:MAG TPA: hypothetical protein VHD15_13560 [Hyphomicrobiales bacterium]|nr:hypothetical protein [Hyphomicrobiales bacterium]
MIDRWTGYHGPALPRWKRWYRQPYMEPIVAFVTALVLGFVMGLSFWPTTVMAIGMAIAIAFIFFWHRLGWRY